MVALVKVFISADLEGISGVVGSSQTGPDPTEEYARACRLMTRQVNAAVAGALEGGADLVVINDSHGSMRNILIEELHPRARLITGSPKPLSMMQGVEGSDLAFFVGYHSMAGTPGVLNHTYSSRTVHALRIAGRAAGETLLNAGIAGHYGVPVVLVTGDSDLAAEAAAVIPGVWTVAVKEAAGRYGALCLPLEEANTLIHDAARDAVREAGAGRVKPLAPPSPATFEIEFRNTAQADAASMIPGTQKTDPLTVVFSHADYIVAFQAARAMITMAYSSE
jgi:D-amino peptidase